MPNERNSDFREVRRLLSVGTKTHKTRCLQGFMLRTTTLSDGSGGFPGRAVWYDDWHGLHASGPGPLSRGGALRDAHRVWYRVPGLDGVFLVWMEGGDGGGEEDFFDA